MDEYKEFKDAKMGWLERIPSHWTTVPLKYSIGKNPFSFVDGDWIESKVIESEGIRYLTTGNVGIINYKEQGNGFISDKTFKDLNCTEVFPGDVLISRLNYPIGRSCIVPDLGCRIVVAVDNVIFRPDETKYNKKYLVYQMNCYPYSENANFIARGSTMQRITRTQLGAFKLCVPPLEEQNAMVSYLDRKCSEIDNVISAQQTRIALLQELKQSVITHAVTKGLNPNVEMKDSGVEWIGKVPSHWEIYKIKNCCKAEQYSIKTGPFGTQLKGEDLQPQGDVAVYSQQNVINNDFTKVRYFVSNKKAEALKGFYTQPNDVLITSRGTIGKAAILSPSYPNGILHPCLIALRLKQEICLNDWLVMYINETDCFKTDVTLSSNATTIDVIYTGTLKNIYIPLPPYKEQIEILAKLKEKCSILDSSISKAQHQVDLLQEYKQSLITEVVTGKRKVC